MTREGVERRVLLLFYFRNNNNKQKKMQLRRLFRLVLIARPDKPLDYLIAPVAEALELPY